VRADAFAGAALPARAILALDRVEARCVEAPWPYAERNAGAIAAAWARRLAAKPALFNGRVLRQSAGRIEGRVFHAEYAPCDYAAFIAWMDNPAADPVSRNGFAMAALRATDGPFLLGVMGAHTVSAGKAYFPAGTPDLGDVMADGRVDLAASALRELAEETGLRDDELTVGDGFTAVLDGPKIAFMRPVTVNMAAEAARAAILERLAGQPQPELGDILIVRGLDDVDPGRMPRFMLDFFGHVFAGGATAP
jgi:8-oxo-dGTP pyrophosphatase MutT (NUDIX family)